MYIIHLQLFKIRPTQFCRAESLNLIVEHFLMTCMARPLRRCGLRVTWGWLQKGEQSQLSVIYRPNEDYWNLNFSALFYICPTPMLSKPF